MLYTQHVLVLLLLDAIHLTLTSGENLVLLYPQSTVFQFTIGMSMPVAKNEKGSIVFSSGFQFNYILPWNLTQFEHTVVQARAPPKFSQLRLENIYSELEDLFQTNGWWSGQGCVLRTICELAKTPLARNDGDIHEEIIHLLFTPSEDSGADDCADRWRGTKRYKEAEILGKSGLDCGQAYKSCANSPLDAFTKIAFSN